MSHSADATSPDPSLGTALSGALEWAINTALKYDPATRQKMATMTDILAINIEKPAFCLYFCGSSEGISVMHYCESPATTEVSGSLSALFTLIKNPGSLIFNRRVAHRPQWARTGTVLQPSTRHSTCGWSHRCANRATTKHIKSKRISACVICNYCLGFLKSSLPYCVTDSIHYYRAHCRYHCVYCFVVFLIALITAGNNCAAPAKNSAQSL